MSRPIRTLRTARKTITECCRNDKTAAEAAEWVRDNARQLLSAISGAEKLLKKEKKAGAEKVFSVCLPLCQRGTVPDEGGLIAELAHEGFTSAECDMLPVFLRASLACTAAKHLNKEDSGAEEQTAVRAVRELLRLGDADFDEVRSGICQSERYLNADPAGIYRDMSEGTKKLYRKAAAKGAEKEGITEEAFLSDVLAQAREDGAHLGFYLPVAPDREKAGQLFLTGELLFSFLLSVLAAILTDAPLSFFLLFPCVFALLKPLSDRLCGRLFPARPLCSMDEERAVSEENETLIVISGLMPEAKKAGELRARLSDIRASDKDGSVRLMLLLDKKAAPSGVMPEDEADEAAVRALIDALNRENGGGFAAAVRKRSFSDTENEYTGFERKRGAVTALIELLRTGNTEAFSMLCGDTEKLGGIRYIAALDSDTMPSFEVLRKLTAIASHPLNRAVIDREHCRVTAGYGCIVPRIETSADSAGASFFSRLFTSGGSLSYAPEVSERYMDMFGQTLFTGKGLIDAEAYHTVIGSRFENGRILSHDILEGALLRTAFAGSCEFTDSFPSKPASYFSRLERWIRGDVQNLKYIFRPVAERPVPSSLPGLTKYQLADNFRRAVTPVFALFSVLAAALFPGKIPWTVPAAAILSECSEDVFSCLSLVLRGGAASLFRLCFSTEITRGLKSLIKLVPDAGLLPEKAAVSLSAVCKGLYRTLFSGRHLLQWTTAQQADNKKGVGIVTAAVIPLLTAAFCFFSGAPAGRLFAAAVLCGVGFSLSDGIPLPKKRFAAPEDADREKLLSFTAAMWKYFVENVNEKENHLPPDNVQETPVRKTAHRTSPTNIGLYLVSVCAAYDLAFISRTQLCERLRATLETVEKLPKYKNCLYNWYDTRTLLPLTPVYVSSVDCGNYLCCLTAVKEALGEYAADDERLSELQRKIGRILSETDLSFLYDRKRKLFAIGCDGSGKRSGAYYDLLMSEFRLTSYYETARRHVPASHYPAPGRQLLRSGRYVTSASWTGTAFEYFMPALFLPTEPGSFIDESLRTALYTQKKRAAKAGIPYGVSESCCYSVDAASNYRYKAHGLQELALKRAADDEPVVSPYSTFLTLPFDLKGGMKNLSRLAAMNAFGSCGFCEAVDFSEKRTDGEDYCVVRCFMAHHLGMSIAAAANVLLDGIFIRRFMNDPDMSSARSLLSEKIPDDPDVFTRRTVRLRGKSVPRPLLRRQPAKEPASEAAAYGNGEWTVFTDVYGRNRSLFSGCEIYRCLPGREGLCVSAKLGDGIVPLNTTLSARGKLTGTAYCSETARNGLRVVCALPVHPSVPALLVPVKLINDTRAQETVPVSVYLEPSLLPFAGTDNHPAFSSLFLRPGYDKGRKALYFERLRAPGAPVLCIGLYAGGFFYEVERERILSRETDREFPYYFASRTPEEIQGTVSPAAAVSFTLTAAPGKSAEAVLVLTCAATRQEALDRLDRIRAKPLPPLGKAAGRSFVSDAFSANAADAMIKNALFGFPREKVRLAAVDRMTEGRNALWQTGISGDLPILTVFAAENCSDAVLLSVLRLHAALKKAGMENDAVFVFRQTEDYALTGEQPLLRLLKQEDMTDETDRPGGVRLLNANSFPESVLTALTAFSAAISPESGEARLPAPVRAEIRQGVPFGGEENGFAEGGYVIGAHPRLPWCHTLSGKSFGTLLTDRSLGFSWALDSGLNRLTPWSNDTAADLNGERLFLCVGDDVYDCVGNARTLFTDSFARFDSLCGEIRVRVTVTVPEKGMKKTVSIALTNTGEAAAGVRLIYRVRPILHGDERYAEFVRFRMTGDGVILTNPANEDVRGFMLLFGSSGAAYNISSESLERYAQSGVRLTLLPARTAETEFGLCFARTPDALGKLRTLSLPAHRTPELSPVRGDGLLPPAALRLLFHQIRDTRLLARTGFYQNSGAFGFRDQLQDVLALTKTEPGRCRELILLACSAQFPEGDVLHWFRPLRRNGRTQLLGTRTRCSDDMLWLPYAAAKYVADTSDEGILHKRIPFLSGEPLEEGERERCRAWSRSDESASVYEHCLRAFAPSGETGPHSLPLMRGGDWNDAFGEVGGESVWLAMFRRAAALSFAPVCACAGDETSRGLLLAAAEKAASACDENAWDGKKYLRAFYDDGTPMGADGRAECEVDLLPQAWAVLSGMPDRERRRTALKTAYERLFDEEHGILKLFAPPFSRDGKRAGYVNDYPPGMRENGGQYTHAAVWFLLALRKEGLDEEADRVLNALLPWKKYETDFGERVYKTEPYALCGDVYAAKGLEGRGGWSLYTGSAGWLLQYFLS